MSGGGGGLRSATEAPVSRYWQCLHNNGCCPWELPWWETILDSIPGVGIIPSFIGWGCRSAKIEKLDDALLLQTSSSRDDGVNSDDGSLSLEDERFTVLEDERTQGEAAAAETRKYDLWTQRNIIAAQRSNSAALFWINFIGCLVGGACMSVFKEYLIEKI